MYTLKSYVEERVPAWEECGHKFNVKDLPSHVMIPGDKHCILCSGSGGTWHEAVRHDYSGISYLWLDDGDRVFQYVTKSSFLVRRWECVNFQMYHTHPGITEPCPFCTAGEWEVS